MSSTLHTLCRSLASGAVAAGLLAGTLVSVPQTATLSQVIRLPGPPGDPWSQATINPQPLPPGEVAGHAQTAL